MFQHIMIDGAPNIRSKALAEEWTRLITGRPAGRRRPGVNAVLLRGLHTIKGNAGM